VRKAFAVLTILLVGALPALAGGPAFTADITITTASPDILLIDTGLNEADWEICVDNGCNNAASSTIDQAFHIKWVDGTSGPQIPFIIEHNTNDYLLFLDGSERIGIGTSTPGLPLSIAHPSPEIHFDDTTFGAGEAFLQLSTNTFTLEGNNGEDIIEFDVRAPVTMDIDANGATTFFGDLAVNSSREAKEGIEAVDGREVLALLKQLPIHRWSYKNDGESAQHMGPMAEDFYAAFGLGRTDKQISVVDPAGVALAAVQELALRVESLEKENGKLRNELRLVQSIAASHRTDD